MLTRYRMDVVCATVVEAIAQAGGLICDRSLTGWDVSVFATRDDACAKSDQGLRMLGATREADMPAEPAGQPLLRAIVVSGDLYHRDHAVRHWVEAAMRESRIEVLMWDTDRPAPDAGHVEMPISHAGSAFLDHALAIVDSDAVRRPSEFYRRLRTGRLRQPVRPQTALTTVNGG